MRACAIALAVAGRGGFFFATWLGLHEPDLLAASGFFGVEPFFVLSSFLIGRLLLRIIATRPTKRALVRLPGLFGTVVRAIGTRSYAIYIVHMPIFEVVAHYIIVAHLPVAVAMLLAPAPIWGLAWAPWWWIEAPILAHRPIRPDPDSPGEAIFYCDTISIQMVP